MAFDKDEFNRYEASQTLATMVLSKLINALEFNAPMKGSESYANAFIAVLNDDKIDNSLKADMLSLPSVSMLMQTRKVLDVEAIYMARNFLKREIVREYGANIKLAYDKLNIDKAYEVNSDEIARRKLKNTLLSYLAALKDETLVMRQYKSANNMTDRLSALTILANSRGEGKKEALKDFYERYKNNTLVMNKYLAVIASSELKETPSNVKALLEDEVFDIKVPNLVRSLIGSFARNALHFHAVDGSGYTFVADKVLELDKLNPQIASGLSGVFKDYAKLNDKAKILMKSELEKILNTKELSKNVYEIVSKILG
jgi:aminopeptidase N